MLNRPLTLLLLLLLILSCDPEESESTNVTDDTAEEMDTTPPVPTITGLEVDLEVTTTINITIQEASEIEEISVLVNQIEILNTKEKTFSFELNPFDYPSGENTLTIVAEDTEGNRSEESQTFEVNKLLVSIASPRVFNTQQAFFSANTLQGELVAFANVTKEVENIKLYANDGFIEQPIVVTSYVVSSGEFYQVDLNSISDLEPGSDLVILQQAAGLNTEDTFVSSPLINPFSIDVLDVNTEDEGKSLFAVGHNHIVEANNTSGNPGAFQSQLNFISNDEPIRDVVLYTSQSGTVAIHNQFNIEDYKYLIIPNPTNQSLSISEFQIASNTNTFNIPSIAEIYNFQVLGFLSESALANNEYRYLYDVNSANTNNQIQFPVIPEYNVFRNNLRISFNGGNSSLEISTLGEKDIMLPAWNASLLGETITLNGDFDKFTTSFSLNTSGGVLNWNYTAKQQESFQLPFDDFELPNELLDFAVANNLDLSSINAGANFKVTLFDSSKDMTYEELLFHPFTYHLLEDVYELSIGL